MAATVDHHVPITNGGQTMPQKLAPDVIQRLQQLQQSNRPVSLDEILAAASLEHLGMSQDWNQSDETASCDASSSVSVKPQRSASMTLAERRRIPESPERLRLNARVATDSISSFKDATLARLEYENAQLPAQDAESDVMAQIKKQLAFKASGHKPYNLDINPLLSIVDKGSLWHYLVMDYPGVAPKVSRLLMQDFRQKGIPENYRGAVWQAMAMSSDTHLVQLYERLVKGEMGMSSYDNMIDRDIAQIMAPSDLSQATARILKAYSVYDAHVGYSQSLIFLLRPLIMTMSETQAFCTFIRLMENYEMRTLFVLNMDGLQLRLHQFQTLLDQLCPGLHCHLTENAIHPPMYAARWFLTLFAEVLPSRLVLRLYDLVLSQGAIPTMIRAAIAILRKHKETLLSIHQFDPLVTRLTKGILYDDDDLMDRIIELSAVITTDKLERIADAFRKEQLQEKNRTEKLLALRLKTTNTGKRESWFTWNTTTTTSTTTTTTTPPRPQDNGFTSPPSSPTTVRLSQDRSNSLLHRQIEDLVTALSQLQKEHAKMMQDLASMKLREADYQSERGKLTKRNAVLERRAKKYKTKLANAVANVTANAPSTQAVTATTEPTSSGSAQPADVDPSTKDEFNCFVESLRVSGDFGALVAGALVPAEATESHSVSSKPESQKTSSVAQTSHDDQDTVQHITSELVNVKLAHFETDQKFKWLSQKHHELQQRLVDTEHEKTALVQQFNRLQENVEVLQAEKEQFLQEHKDWTRENETLVDRRLMAKHTAAELQFEKMELENKAKQLEARVQALENEKKEYMKPRESFSEEVFAAHQVLFGRPTPHSAEQTSNHTQHQKERRHTLQIDVPINRDEYQVKYVESDLRCRELEKLLAEAKVKLAEYESSSVPVSPRGSLQQGYPWQPVHMKRISTTSLSMLASRITSPSSTDAMNRRDSTESYASSITSATSMGSTVNPKRSSVYAHLWNPFGTQ